MKERKKENQSNIQSPFVHPFFLQIYVCRFYVTGTALATRPSHQQHTNGDAGGIRAQAHDHACAISAVAVKWQNSRKQDSSQNKIHNNNINNTNNL